MDIEHILRHARDGAIVDSTRPWIVGTDPVVNHGRLKHRIGFSTYYLLSQYLHLLVHQHVRQLLYGILLVQITLLVVWFQVLQDFFLREYLSTDFVTELHFETGGLSFHGFLFHVDRVVQATIRMSGWRRSGEQLEVALTAIVERIRKPCLDDFTGRHGIGRNLDEEGSIHLLPITNMVDTYRLGKDVLALCMQLGIFLFLVLNHLGCKEFTIQEREVADGLAEPTFFPVDDSGFEILLLFPSLYLLVGSTGHFFQQQFLSFFTGQAEIIPYAGHHGLQGVNQPSMFSFFSLAKLANGLLHLGKFALVQIRDSLGFPCLCMEAASDEETGDDRCYNS